MHNRCDRCNKEESMFVLLRNDSGENSSLGYPFWVRVCVPCAFRHYSKGVSGRFWHIYSHDILSEYLLANKEEGRDYVVIDLPREYRDDLGDDFNYEIVRPYDIADKYLVRIVHADDVNRVYIIGNILGILLAEEEYRYYLERWGMNWAML